ncbi:hypothetical protein [Azospirillum melinis]
MAALDEVSRIELRYSRFRSDSDLSAINRVASLGGSVELDEETAGLIECAALCHRASGGLFDITAAALRHGASLDRIGFGRLTWDKPRLTFQAGMSIDFGGLAKEYAVDRAVEMLRFQGVRHGLVDLGGDMAVVGPHPDGTPWKIGIRDPQDTRRPMAELTLGGGAVATSGNYERFATVAGERLSHIVDPATGRSPSGLMSVSVVADRCLAAGCLSTIGMLKGLDGTRWLAELGVSHLWQDENGRIGGTLGLG